MYKKNNKTKINIKKLQFDLSSNKKKEKERDFLIKYDQ
jgi:hypothetical protein